MFERRLRVILLVLCVVMFTLLLRAGQIQIAQAATWSREAEQKMTAARMLDATRGRILDIKGRELAVDVPSIDARVDYRAISNPPEKQWLFWEAHRRCQLKDPAYLDMPRPKRDEARKAESVLILQDIDLMWEELARVGKVPLDEVLARRDEVIATVQSRLRILQNSRYETALEKWQGEGGSGSWLKWLGFSHEKPTPKMFADETVAEQSQAHIILRSIDTNADMTLQKKLNELPGLSLTTGRRRTYPYGEIACHVIGRLSSVNANDRETDPFSDDDLRRYLPQDLIGRAGLEQAWEAELRGTRGTVEKRFAADVIATDITDALGGKDVYCTLDIELCRDIYRAFEAVPFPKVIPSDPELITPMPGAAVVIDVSTGEIRAMVSNPGFDPNRFEELYPQLVADGINRPLMNRATQFALEPGSTVKTIVGIAAIMEGVVEPMETIECNGFMQINGHDYVSGGRCWTMSMYGLGHHQLGTSYDHPTGHLTFPEALQRSCNVFFETCADRLGYERISNWMRAIGLGRPVGIGIPEVAGLVPDEGKVLATEARGKLWSSGIGQGPVAATPLQLANMASTFARDGLWTRPTLAADPSQRPQGNEPLTRDLHISSIALAELKLGMFNVVNTAAGTGQLRRRDSVRVAGKTGSAQAGRLTEAMLDDDGNRMLDEHGTPRNRLVAVPMRSDVNVNVPWYRSLKHDEVRLAHSWYICFLPADNPKIAVAVFVEYGGSGGTAAGAVTNRVIDALEAHGYVAK